MFVSQVHTKVCEKQEKVKAYEALQTLLLTELPVLNFNGLMVVVTACHALAAARLYLQGRMARIYLQLSQVRLTPREEFRAVQFFLYQLPVYVNSSNVFARLVKIPKHIVTVYPPSTASLIAGSADRPLVYIIYF